MLKGYRELAQVDGDVPVEGVRIPSRGRAELVDDLLTTGVRFSGGRKGGEIIKTRSPEQAKLILKIIELGEAGRSHLLPIDDKVIAAQIVRIESHIEKRYDYVNAMISARTNDPELQEKAFSLTMARF